MGAVHARSSQSRLRTRGFKQGPHVADQTASRNYISSSVSQCFSFCALIESISSDLPCGSATKSSRVITEMWFVVCKAPESTRQRGIRHSAAPDHPRNLQNEIHYPVPMQLLEDKAIQQHRGAFALWRDRMKGIVLWWVPMFATTEARPQIRRFLYGT